MVDRIVLWRLFVGVGLLLGGRGSYGQAPAATEAPQPAPLFAGKELPKPPRAEKPWTPPESALADDWSDVVRDLLKHGFADPRGLEYREVELICGSVWSDQGRIVKTHGWLLPKRSGDPADAPRFATAWNGLVYPAIRVGGPADWRADAESTSPPKQSPFRGNEEGGLISHQGTSLVKGCLLLVLGEGALAEKHLAGKVHPADVTYLAAARLWAWALFDRAVCARLRGDDVISLESAKLLVAWRDAVELESPRRIPPRPLVPSDKKRAYLDFLRPLDDLVKDQERRVAAAPLRRVLDPARPKIENASERIAALVRDLETVDVTQHSQPGGVDVTWHPLVEALVKEGDAAVEPLLKCIESDRRLTRSVGFGRDFGTDRYLIGVQEPAFGVFRRMFNSLSFGPNAKYPLRGEYGPADPEQCALAAAEIRAFWNKTRGMSEAERWYAVLVDDKATEGQWLEAAQGITASMSRERPRLGAAAEISGPQGLDVWKPLVGEALRSKTDPSVAELLAARSDILTTRDLGDTRRLHHLGTACELALCLARWDGKGAALPTLESRIQECRRLTYDKSNGGYAVDHFNAMLPMMLMVGVEMGKRELLGEYVGWLGDMRGKRVSFPRAVWNTFRPLARYHREPALRRAAEEIFADGSPWIDRPEIVGSWFELYGSPLVNVPAFRGLLKRKLADRGEFGTATLDARGTSINVRHKFGGMGRVVAPPADPENPRYREPIPVRVADLVAWRISAIRGAPSFQLYWPEAERDAQLAKIVAFLDAYGNAYGERSFLNPPQYFGHEFDLPTAEFYLAKRERAATKKDVEEGLAVFSLDDGGAKARPVALPEFPQRARWTSQAGERTAAGAAAKPRVVDGYVWQAEEIETDGRLQRYYGFVGRHDVVRVPAEEVEFLDEAGSK